MRGNVRLAVTILNPTRLFPRDRGAKPPAPVPNAGCSAELRGEAVRELRRHQDPQGVPGSGESATGRSPRCRDCHAVAKRGYRARHGARLNAARLRDPIPERTCRTCGQTFMPVRMDQNHCRPAPLAQPHQLLEMSFAQYHLPRAKPPKAISPIKTMISPIQRLHTNIRMIPTITMMPPSEMPAIPRRSSDPATSSLLRVTFLSHRVSTTPRATGTTLGTGVSVSSSARSRPAPDVPKRSDSSPSTSSAQPSPLAEAPGGT